MTKQPEFSRPRYSRRQVDLFGQWVCHFDAIDASELDLGTLTAIHERVMDGLAPTTGDEIGRERLGDR